MEEKPKDNLKKKITLAQKRLQKDFSEVAKLKNVKLVFPDPKNIQKFIVEISPNKGIWKDGIFQFNFDIPDDFPFERPHVTSITRIWHPNIEETGAICLNILRDNYTPAIDIAFLIVGLQFLFEEPNPESPLNQEAANQFKTDKLSFMNRVQQYIQKYCPKKEI